MDRSDPTRVEQNALCQRRLARVNVRRDADVAQLLRVLVRARAGRRRKRPRHRRAAAPKERQGPSEEPARQHELLWVAVRLKKFLCKVHQQLMYYGVSPGRAFMIMLIHHHSTQ